MSLRIAFDLDGVLANMEAELVRQAGILFGESVTSRLRERAVGVGASAAGSAADAVSETPPAASDTQATAEASLDNVPPLSTLTMTARQQRRLWSHVESIENFWCTLEEPEPGIIAALSTIARERRWEVIFLTKRPETIGMTAQMQSQRWLESKGFALPSVYVVQGTRGRVAAALDLDIVVDDRPENCLDVVIDSKARAILVWRDAEKELPAAARRLGIGVVASVAACLDVLTQLDSKTRDQPGVMDRVMRLLGLKEPTSA